MILSDLQKRASVLYFSMVEWTCELGGESKNWELGKGFQPDLLLPTWRPHTDGTHLSRSCTSAMTGLMSSIWSTWP